MLYSEHRRRWFHDSVLALVFALRRQGRASSLCVIVFVLVASGAASVVEARDNPLKVRVSGIDGELLVNVQKYLSINTLLPTQELSADALLGREKKSYSDNEVRRYHRRAETEIREALQPYGYYEPLIETSLKKKDGQWHADYRIEPGPLTIIGQVEVRVEGPGGEEAEIRQLLDTLPLKTGEPLIHSIYDSTKKNLREQAVSLGYLDTKFLRSEMRVLRSARRADLFLIIDTGPKYYFGPVSIQQDILDPGFISRYVNIETGTPFNTEKLLDVQLALDDSGYFKRVEIEIKRENTREYHIPVTVNTEANKPRQYSTGVGYGTDTGARLSLGAEFHRINRRGHSVRSDLRVSQVRNSLGLSYRIPIKNVATDHITLAASTVGETIGDDGDTNRETIGVSYNDRWNSMRRRVYLNFERENFNIGEDSDTVAYLIPGASLSHRKADQMLVPRRGYSWSAELRGAVERVVAETSFLRSNFNARAVLPLGSRGRFLFRGELGATAVDDFTRLPGSERYFAGGDQSVRGYAYQDIGPTDSSGENIGGRFLVTSSVEADYLVKGNFGLAVFVDAGDAFDASSPDFKVGAGAGVRWRSPIGMLRLDVAHPFVDTDDEFRIHISIGQDL